jgi:hypothetical protein
LSILLLQDNPQASLTLVSRRSFRPDVAVVNSDELFLFFGLAQQLNEKVSLLVKTSLLSQP